VVFFDDENHVLDWVIGHHTWERCFNTLIVLDHSD
jgi:hypothetical protein